MLAGDGAVAEAQDWGAAETRVRDEQAEDPVVYTAHPLFSERARAALGDDGARRRRTELVTLQSQHPSDHLSDRLRLASLALDSDAPQPVAEVVDAAQQALRLGDLTLGERLARSAMERSGWQLAARLPLANALALQGRGREAEALLAAVDSAALSEAELMAWTLLRAANQFFMLSEPERATAFLQTIRNRVPDAGPRLTLDALSATFAMNAGNVGRCRRDRPCRCWRHRRPTTRRWPGRPARPRCARRGRAASTTSSRWRSARWAPSTRGCCGSRSAWARPRPC